MSLLLPYFIPPENVLLCDALTNIRAQLDTNVLNAMVGHAVSSEYAEALCLIFLQCLAQVQQQCRIHAGAILARNDAMDVCQAGANVVRLWLRVCLNREMIGQQHFRDVHTAINQVSVFVFGGVSLLSFFCFHCQIPILPHPNHCTDDKEP